MFLRGVHGTAVARGLLELVGEIVPVDYLAISEYPEAAPPSMLEGEANARDNITAECFKAYRRRFFRYDAATGLARDLRRGQTTRCHQLTGLQRCSPGLIRNRRDQMDDSRQRTTEYVGTAPAVANLTIAQ